MKIYVFGTRGFPGVQGGVEKHCEHLYPLLAGQFRITVFRRKPFVGKEQTPPVTSRLRFRDLPSTRIRGFEAVFHSFLCTLCCIVERPDAVHIHNIGPGMFIPLLRLFRLKVVLTYHSPNYEHAKWNAAARRILKLSEYAATTRATRIIFVNRERMEAFPEKIRSKSVAIPNGVVIRDKTARTDYLTARGLFPGKYILTVGRITQEKGFDCLIDAFLQSGLSGYQLALTGSADHASEYAREIRRRIEASPLIVGTGYADAESLRQLYSHAALFVLASRNEGFPLVLLEAMSYGLPILASDISANKLLNLEPSDYFRVGCPEELAVRLAEKINRQETSRRYDLAAYTWESIARRTADVFSNL
jgi:glycosyltransferase involved in cell wall biosynthesis